ncbi:MAG: rhomboid family intramembrane serine protease [Acidobacteria bacterium]|nr:rhomboid family intramembrane serine protease [Acidobacteriota bacterium]
MEFVNDDEERPGLTPEEFLAERKKQMRRNSWWSIGAGASVVALNIALAAYVLNSPDLIAEFKLEGRGFFSILLRSILFLLGMFFIAGGIWGLYEARRLTLEDLIPSPEAVEFFSKAEGIVPVYSYIILGCLIAVFAAQYVVGSDDQGQLQSVLIAGLIKPDVITKGEYWRILTSGVLHAGLLHIYFNAQAFFGFGGLIEIVSDRARMAIVFVLAIIGGALFSALFTPEGISVGASGGIMGLIGYLAVYGQRRKRQLPSGFMRNMLVNIAFVAAFGLVGYKFIDNFAHLGGLLVGAVYGLLTIPRDAKADPRQMSAFTDGAGLVALGIIVFISVFTILMITGQIQF